VQVCLSKIC